MEGGPVAVGNGYRAFTVFLPLLGWEQVVGLGIGWEAGEEKTLINGAVWDKLALAKPLAP